jgi:hypothetical protein
MALTSVLAGGRQVEIEHVAPAAQASTNSVAVVAGSEIDARAWRTLAYTIRNSGAQTITIWVYGANAASYADEVIVSGPTDVLTTAATSYAVSPAPYGYYRVKVDAKVDGQQGEATVVGIAKA